MSAMNIVPVPVSRIFLYLENPRHIPFDSEAQAIEYLCANEGVHALARDIAKRGLNPFDPLALLPIQTPKGKSAPKSVNYHAAEGNRRICALKLLNDPELAPAKLRKSFEKLSEEWIPIKTVNAVLFKDYETVRPWLDRIHNGPQGGIGRKAWNAEQKTRFDGDNKNKPAQALLDYAAESGMISNAERKGKLTTVQRFLSNEVFREAIGFDQSNVDAVGRTRPKAEFDILVRRFMRDLVGGEAVNSRMNKKAIVDYARPLSSISGISSSRIEPESLTNNGDSQSSKKPRRKTPKKPERTQHVQYDEDIYQALTALGHQKLRSLYNSIVNIELDHHTPIVAVGVWSFFETLTACAGRTHTTDFTGFLSKQKLANYGLSTNDAKTLQIPLGRIRDYGNTTKHDAFAATFNGDQLNNDIVTLKKVLLACIAEAGTKTK